MGDRDNCTYSLFFTKCNRIIKVVCRSEMDLFASSSSSLLEAHSPHVLCILCNQRVYKRHLSSHIKMEHFFGYKPYHCGVSWCLENFPTLESYEYHRQVKHPREAHLSVNEIPDLEATCDTIYDKSLSPDSKIDLSSIDFDRFYSLIFENTKPQNGVSKLNDARTAAEHANSTVLDTLSTMVDTSPQNTNNEGPKITCKLCENEYSKNSYRKHVLTHLKKEIKFIYYCLLCDQKDPNLCRTVYMDTIIGHVMKKHGIKRHALKTDVHYKSLYKKYAPRIEEMIVKCFK